MSDKRPKTTVILAMTADGKIADFQRKAARFSSKHDQRHLERQISLVDGVLFGSRTLHAYGTSLPITNPELLATRKQSNKPSQPVHIVVSASGNIDPTLRFFRQSIPRWLLTTQAGKINWSNHQSLGFENVILVPSKDNLKLKLSQAFQKLKELGLNHVGILGGGELVAACLEENLIDELWLTICPLILGGRNAPTIVEGQGFISDNAKPLKLLSVETIEQEIFLHYQVCRDQ